MSPRPRRVRVALAAAAAVVALLTTSGAVAPVSAHPGGTDAAGCHVCRTNCPRWGVPTGVRHCHGGGGSTGGGTVAPAPAPPPPLAPPPPPPPPESVTRPQITRLYLAYFKRPPDEPGLAYWVSRMSARLPLAAVSQEFTRSAEFTSTYGPALSSGDFVKLVYRNVLGREPDPAGYAHWAPLVEARVLSRGELMVAFSESPEFKAITGTT